MKIWLIFCLSFLYLNLSKIGKNLRRTYCEERGTGIEAIYASKVKRPEFNCHSLKVRVGIIKLKLNILTI